MINDKITTKSVDSDHECISELSPNNILSSSLFLISEFNKDNEIFSSKKVDFSQVSSTFINDIKKYPLVNISGEWTFTGTGQGTTTLSAITIETASITLPESVINEDYLSANFSKIFNQLSSDLFSRKFRLPSYVGQIIMGTTLKNETTIRKYYGDNTRWQQLPGRFLLPVTSNAAALTGNKDLNGVSISKTGVMAGSTEHSFSILDMNQHSHNFIPGKNDKKISKSHTYYPLDDGTRIANVYVTDDVRYKSTTTGDYDPDSTYYTNYYTARPITLEFAGGWCNPWERRKRTSVGIYGIGKNKIKISPKGSRAESKTFTKLPPFYSVYMWKRI